MYYIPSYIETKNGLNINKQILVDEESNIICTFVHTTEKGYMSNKPLIVDFEYTINEYNEIAVTDEVAQQLIARYKDVKYKIFQTPSSYNNNMVGLKAWAAVLENR